MREPQEPPFPGSPSQTPDEQRLYERIWAVVRQIPAGKVATYGQIASIVGDCTARMVGYAMAATPSGHDVPWQRVINAQGKISLRAHSEGAALQRRLLESEGIRFDANGKVNLRAYRWYGPDIDWLLENGFRPFPLYTDDTGADR
jgi:methylated-DNA-protein-cysteine methyltransferase-like protein